MVGQVFCVVMSLQLRSHVAEDQPLSLLHVVQVAVGLVGPIDHSLSKSRGALELALHLQRHFCTKLCKMIHPI